MSIKRLKVSFIDKDTMCAVDPQNVIVRIQDDSIMALLESTAPCEDPFFEEWELHSYKEVEIKIIN